LNAFSDSSNNLSYQQKYESYLGKEYRWRGHLNFSVSDHMPHFRLSKCLILLSKLGQVEGLKGWLQAEVRHMGFANPEAVEDTWIESN